MKKSKKKRVEPELEWRASRTVRRQEELYHHGESLATLRWTSLFDVAATGTARTGQWHLDRPRLLSRDVEIHTANAPYGTFSPGWTAEGTLWLEDGRTFRWVCEDFWQTRWTFVDEHENPVMHFVDTSGFLQERTAIVIPPSSLEESDRALLSILGRYLIALQARDTAAASAAVTAAVI
jgi:hypothetical protein